MNLESFYSTKITRYTTSKLIKIHDWSKRRKRLFSHFLNIRNSTDSTVLRKNKGGHRNAGRGRFHGNFQPWDLKTRGHSFEMGKLRSANCFLRLLLRIHVGFFSGHTSCRIIPNRYAYTTTSEGTCLFCEPIRYHCIVIDDCSHYVWPDALH